MQKIIKYVIVLSLSILCFSTTYVYAQEKAPTFQSLVASGDKEFSQKEFIKAKTYYQEALRLKPNDNATKGKLDKTLQMIREQNKKEEQFFDHIDKADNFYSNNEFENALTEYNKALKIFPKDEYALGKKNEITKFLQEEKERIDEFNKMLALGDNLLKNEKFAEAVLQYESALKVYPNNTTAQNKYSEALNKKEAYDAKISEFQRLKAKGQEFTLRKKYNEAIDVYEQALQLFPNETELADQINELKARQNTAERYEAQINEADALYEKESYNEAKKSYQAALSVLPDDSYSIGMIARIDEIINSPEYKLEEQRKADEQTIAATIVEEKASATETIATEVIEAEAVAVATIEVVEPVEPEKPVELEKPVEPEKPVETPKNKVIVELATETIMIKSGDGKRFEFQPVDISTRRGNSLHIKAKNLSDRSYTLYILFGNKNARQGSLSVTVPNDKELNDYTVRIGSQYKWFSEDNTWIEILPQGGNIEISSMEIIKGN